MSTADTPDRIGGEPIPAAPEVAADPMPAPSAAAVSSDPAGAHPVEDVDAAPPAKPSAADEISEIIKTVIYALLIAFVVRTLFFQPFTIPSASEEPNLYEGDYIIISKWTYGYSRHSIWGSPPLLKGRLFEQPAKRGDVVVFKLPRDDKTDYIKRIVGLPGDQIQMRDGRLYINNSAVTDALVGVKTGSAPGGDAPAQQVRETFPDGSKSFMTQDFGRLSDGDKTGVYTVPEGCYFMMGDNRDNSLDSRFDPNLPPGKDSACGWDPAVDQYLSSQAGVGFVPAANLEGKAQIVLFSWTKGASLFKPWTWVTHLRPSRFFTVLH